MKETGFEIEGVDWREMAKYVKMNMTEFEIMARKLHRIIPVRKYKKGKAPGMTGGEATKKKKDQSEAEENEERFVFPDREATEEEKILLFATSLEIAVKFLFSNHLYMFGGQTFRQSDGGSIGMRATMSISRLVMGEWGEKIREILKESNIKTFLEALYVDDLRYVLSCLPHGWRWSQDEKKFIFKEEWEQEDDLSGESNVKRMSTEVCKAMNSVYSFLNFTVETEEDFPNSRLPSLDTELFMEDVPGKKRQKINFSFFEKKMKTPFCILKDSAMAERSKSVSYLKI